MSNAGGGSVCSRSRTIESMFDAAPGQARSSRARAGDPRAAGSASGPSSSCASGTAAARSWSFIDGPVTANKCARRPHGLGPDAEGRLPALQGAARLRPALPERLRLPGALDRGRRRARSSGSTRSARSRSTGSRSSRAAAARSSSGRRRQLTRGSIRLGQWMDWGNDYFTFSDTNIEYIWRFLKIVHERGWLYIGHRSTEWCPRCGTSLSQHELTQARRLPGPRRPVALRPLPAARPADGESVVVWTTTPWTLPGERRGRRPSRRRVRPPRERRVGRRRAATRTTRSSSRVQGVELVGWRYRGPVRRPRAGRRGRASRRPVGRGDDGPGHRHRPHRAGLRRRGLRARRRSHDLPVLTPVDESGRFYDDYGWLHGLSTIEAADQIVGRPRRDAASSSRPGSYTHAYPHCWRCDTPLDLPALRRLVHRGRRDPADSCSRRTRRSSGCPSTWASAWTTGCATWATGTSRAAATTACRCRSTRARAGT